MAVDRYKNRTVILRYEIDFTTIPVEFTILQNAILCLNNYIYVIFVITTTTVIISWTNKASVACRICLFLFLFFFFRFETEQFSISTTTALLIICLVNIYACLMNKSVINKSVVITSNSVFYGSTVSLLR